MIKWHKYPKEKPTYGMHWCKLDNGEPKELSWDSVYGWCSDWDEMDYPHFIYDWNCEWAEIDSKNEEEWDRILKEWEEKRYLEQDNSFDWDSCEDEIDEDVWG